MSWVRWWTLRPLDRRGSYYQQVRPISVLMRLSPTASQSEIVEVGDWGGIHGGIVTWGLL
jgi:hypothetical protein